MSKSTARRHETHQKRMWQQSDMSPLFRRPFARFLLRWFINSLGLWIAAGLLSGSITYTEGTMALILAGFVLSVVNTVLKPIIILLSLPAIVFSLGLFMIIVNGLMVYLVGVLYSSLQVANFGTAILAGMVIGLVNYLVTTIVEDYRK